MLPWLSRLCADQGEDPALGHEEQGASGPTFGSLSEGTSLKGMGVWCLGQMPKFRLFVPLYVLLLADDWMVEDSHCWSMDVFPDC